MSGAALSPLPHDLYVLAKSLIEKSTACGTIITSAESCTGGLISSALTEIAGSSAVFDRGFVTYSNDAKHEMLGVPMALIKAHGAVSSEVAQAMAEGALERSRADISVSVTGVAGPGGGTKEKPVGYVWFGLASKKGGVKTFNRTFGDTSRAAIRMQTVETALKMLLSTL